MQQHSDGSKDTVTLIICCDHQDVTMCADKIGYADQTVGIETKAATKNQRATFVGSTSFTGFRSSFTALALTLFSPTAN